MNYRRTLLLINPVDNKSKGFIDNANVSSRYQPLNLGILAAMTPRDWKIKIMDENIKPFHYYPADLVGFTSMTITANRVYELAQIYRKKGIKTVMGGIHATMCPEEAAHFVDSVVIGEAESVWEHLLDDFETGNMQQYYRGIYTDLVHSPKPRRDLFFPGYFFGSIQTNRGCPNNCDYCSVTAFNGSRFRFRPTDEVIAEMKEIPQKWMMIVDDNIVGHSKKSQERAKELFRAMIDNKINKYWWSQTSVDVADDEEVLELAAKSGCKLLFIGIENENAEQLEMINKKVNVRVGVDRFNKIFKKIHQYGIGITVGSIYGFPTDTKETIDRRIHFFKTCHVDGVQSSLMTAFPGTTLFKKLQKSNRLDYTNFPEDWQYYSFENLSYTPEKMGRQEMQDYVYEQLQKVYNARHIKIRFYQTFWWTKSLVAAYHSYLGYWFYRLSLNKKWEDGSIRWVEKLLKKENAI
ncbi:MAG: radical SAM protein [Bacteroidota bacterium]|nr:radical SAM protein [Bacteroidota bacterium]